MSFMDAFFTVAFAFFFFTAPFIAVAVIAKLMNKYFPKPCDALRRVLGFGDIQPWTDD